MRTVNAILGSLLATGLATGSPAAPVYPGADWAVAVPESLGMDSALLDQAVAFAGGSGMIVRSGYRIRSWGDVNTRFDIKSCTKSVGSLLLGIAIAEGRVALEDPVAPDFEGFGVPPQANEDTGWLAGITFADLATHTAGFELPAGYGALVYEPAAGWLYSDTGANWLSDALTLAFQEGLLSALSSRVLGTVGIPPAHLTWRDHWYRKPFLEGIPRREFGAGIHASVDAMARLGYLCLRGGAWDGVQVVPASYIDLMRSPYAGIAALANQDEATFPGAAQHYGLLWWSNGDGTMAGVPADAYWAWGLWESLIVVIPSLDLVAVRVGDGWQSPWTSDYAVLAPFFQPIAAAASPSVGAPEMEAMSWGSVRAMFRDGAGESAPR